MIPTWAVRTKADELAIEQGCYWDQDKANAIIEFTHKLFQPQFISGKFRLLQWQERFLMSLYGWRHPNGNRRFRIANLHIAKKQGKTLLVSIISAFELLKGEDQSPYVVTGSVSKDNASQVFNELRHTITKAKLTKWCKITANSKRIRVEKLNASYVSLASDGDRVQGYNCSCVILDELHAHKNSSLYDSLKYATAARENGILIAISTAGDDVSQFYHGIYSKSKRIISGEDTDITWYGEVYESDIEGDHEDEKEWAKANPSLGVSFTLDQFRLDLLAAKNDPAEWNRFRRYRLNQWVRPDENAYFTVTLWDKYRTIIPDSVLSKFDCFLGIDLSMAVDPSSISAVWCLPNREFYVKSWAWVARQGVYLRERTSLPRYEQFNSEGWMNITEGDRIDDLQIYAHLLALCKQFKVKTAVFDPTSAMILMGMLQSEGVKVERMSQTARYYSAPMKEFQKAILEGRVKNDGNNWLRYCLNNVRVDEDRTGQIRPFTKRSIDHIDGAIAALMAFSQAAPSSATPAKSVYDQRGVIWV